ncbi:MAG: signal peptidase I [Niabella sp.]
MFKRKYLVFSMVIISFVLLTCIHLLWLWFGLLLFILIFKLASSSSIVRANIFLYLLVHFSIVMVLSICCRLFIFEIYTVPSNSMEDALCPGNKLLVSKLHYGPKLPQSVQDIPFINLVLKSKNRDAGMCDAKNNSNKRLRGFSEIKYGDMIIFKRSGKKNFLVKRLLGMSGDKFQIVNSKVVVNGQIMDEFPTFKRQYSLLFLNNVDIKGLTEKLNVEFGKRSDINDYMEVIAILNQSQLQDIKKAKGFISAEVILMDNRSYPRNEKISWSVDNMGPFLVPRKGMTIVLDSVNYILYARAIKTDEGVPLVENDGKYFVNERQVTHYTFLQNYYFVLGDNKNSSNDSRYWGFVSENGVVGKVAYVLL